MAFLAPFLDENELVHHAFKDYNNKSRLLMETVEQIGALSQNPAITDWIRQEWTRAARCPFADQPSDHLLTQRLDSFLFTSEKTPI
jgi:hypothetical protein